ncbi:MAG: threonine aldolase family protein [Candidatus Aminicenantia bacterium]
MNFKEYSDFRSDTVTRPTEKMRKAMGEAEVGDDVLGDDPTVKKLEILSAQKIGKEAALFVPSGTMGNAIAVKVWTKELEEVIVEERSHIYNMESTHLTFVSRVMPRPLASNRGAMSPEIVEKAIRKPAPHIPGTSLICLENTHNNWGGAVIFLENFKELKKIAKKYNIKIHLDGARIFNASLASGVAVKEYAKYADSVMFCLSKGLSAPIGSMLIGSKEFIEQARRVRKLLGGGMRQVGVIAAAGIIALTEMVDRLIEDHKRAKKLAQSISDLPGIELNPDLVETNIIIFKFNHPKISTQKFLTSLKEKGVLALAMGNQIRFVTHKDIKDDDIEQTINAFKKILVN